MRDSRSTIDMDPRKLWLDARHGAYCAYCGAEPDSIDHVPSKALLDEPFPQNLPVVGACSSCNNGFSLDEEYVAVALECAAVGSADPAVVSRPKVARKLREVPALAKRLAASLSHPDLFRAQSIVLEQPRIARILLKLARGHVAYEFGERVFDDPSRQWFRPLQWMTEEEKAAFEAPPQYVLPEIGSRAFLDALVFDGHVVAQDWQVVQQGRYRYLAVPGSPLLVRMVLSEYLAAEVGWG